MQPLNEEEKSKLQKILLTCEISDEVASICKELEETETSDSVSGVTYTHLTVRFVNEDVSPLHLLIRRIPEESSVEENVALSLTEIFNNEILFHKTFMVDAKSFVAEYDNEVDYATYDIVPKCYYADGDTIISENVEAKNYYMLPLDEGMNYLQTQKALEKMAQLHGISYAMFYNKTKEEIFAKYPFLHEWKKDTLGPWRNIMPNWNANLKICVKLLEHSSFPGAVDTFEFFSQFVDKYFQEICEQMNFDVQTVGLVLNHGDFWLENLLFLEDPNTKKPIDVVMTNPQCCLASPAFDLAHLMFSGVQAHLRKNNWEYLLDVYYETFSETANQLKADFKFTLNDLIEDYKKKAKFGVVFALPKLIGTRFQHMLADSNEEVTVGQYDDWIKSHAKLCKPLTLEIIAGINHYLSLE